MANFYANSVVWTFTLAGWGIATGIGLLRVWRWARISALVFSGLLAAFGIAEAVASLRMPGDVDTPSLGTHHVQNFSYTPGSYSDCSWHRVAGFLHSERCEGLFSSGLARVVCCLSGPA